MTAPIPVFEDSTIAGSRRTERGACYLTPNDEVREFIVYLALYYARRHKLRLLVLCIMSNHIHWVAEDPEGRYPDFLRDFHARLTEVLNDHYGLEGPMWSNGKPYRARCLDDLTVEEKALYAANNPVWHGITPRAKLWPGLIFSPEDVGNKITAKCPPLLLDKYNGFDESISYTVPIPKIYAGMTAARVRTHFRDRRLAREMALRTKRRKPYLGVEKALEAGPDTIPDPKDDPRELTNEVFATTGDKDAARDALSGWRSRYYETRKKFRKGKRGVCWPYGTYAMKRWHNCPRRRRLA